MQLNKLHGMEGQLHYDIWAHPLQTFGPYSSSATSFAKLTRAKTSISQAGTLTAKMLASSTTSAHFGALKLMRPGT